MKVTRNKQLSTDAQSREFTEEKMQKDFDYEMAERLTKKLMIGGLISENEAAKISKLNKLNFESFYKELLD